MEVLAGTKWRSESGRIVEVQQVRRPVGAVPYAIVREVTRNGNFARGYSRLGCDKRDPFDVMLCEGQMRGYYPLEEA